MLPFFSGTYFPCLLQFDLLINHEKTKYLKCSTSNYNKNVEDNLEVYAILAFKYLSVKVNGITH